MRRLSTTIRSFVSKRKVRYREDDFNLDLTYITTRVVAMGFPSESLEGLYRNPMKEVQRFFKLKHASHYKMYNLCQERNYPADRFEKVACYPFRDHKCPHFQMILEFCQDAAQFIRSDPKNVVAIHCKAGKGRTGMMVCCLLIFMKTCPTAEAALQLYARQRTQDESGVSIPSQRRWVYYFEEFLRLYFPLNKPLPDASVSLRMIRFSSIPNFDGGRGCEPYFKIKSVEQDTLYSWKKGKGKGQTKNFKGGVGGIEFRIPEGIELKGDFEVTFFDKDPLKKDKKMFWMWINSAFVGPAATLTFSKAALDGAVKDKKHKHFSPNFKVQLFFLGSVEAEEMIKANPSETIVLLPAPPMSADALVSSTSAGSSAASSSSTATSTTSSAPASASAMATPASGSPPSASAALEDRKASASTSASITSNNTHNTTHFVESAHWLQKRRRHSEVEIKTSETSTNGSSSKVALVRGAMTIGSSSPPLENGHSRKKIIGVDGVRSPGQPSHMHSLSTSGLEMHSPGFHEQKGPLDQPATPSDGGQSISAAATLGYASVARLGTASVSQTPSTSNLTNSTATETSSDASGTASPVPASLLAASAPDRGSRFSISGIRIMNPTDEVVGSPVLSADSLGTSVTALNSIVEPEHELDDAVGGLRSPDPMTTDLTLPSSGGSAPSGGRMNRGLSFISYATPSSGNSTTTSGSVSPELEMPVSGVSNPSPRMGPLRTGSFTSPSPRSSVAEPSPRSNLASIKAGSPANKFSFSARFLNRTPSPSHKPAQLERRPSTEPYRLSDVLKQMADDKKEEEVKVSTTPKAASSTPTHKRQGSFNRFSKQPSTSNVNNAPVNATETATSDPNPGPETGSLESRSRRNTAYEV